MVEHTTTLRVRYAETDRMGYVYYGVYPTYLEVARAEWIRSLGLSYRELEEQHAVMMPVVELAIHYKKPARYDELLTLITTVKREPSVRIDFSHRIINENHELVLTAEVQLVFCNLETQKPIRPPKIFRELMAPHF
jgi:acyl-CoA thioester hydrolase